MMRPAPLLRVSISELQAALLGSRRGVHPYHSRFIEWLLSDRAREFKRFGARVP